MTKSRRLTGYRVARYAVGYGLWCYLIILLSQVVLAAVLPDPSDPNYDWKGVILAAGMAHWVMMMFGLIIVPFLLVISLIWKEKGSELRIGAVLAALVIMVLFRTEIGAKMLSQMWWPF